LKGPWTAVFSRQEDQFDDQWTARPSDRSANLEELNAFKSLGGRNEDDSPALAPLGQRELNKDALQEPGEYSQQELDEDNKQDLDDVTTAESSTMNVLQEA
jgi:hypothetical protein